MSDILFDNEPEKKGAEFTSQFSFRQIGSITSIVEPIGAGIAVEEVHELFTANPELEAVPIERDGTVVGVLDKITIESLNASAWQKFWQKDLDQYAKCNSFILQANDFIEKNINQILELNRTENTKFFCVYQHRNFLGVVGLHDFLSRVTEIRNQDMAKAKMVQQQLLEDRNKDKPMPFKLATWNRMANEVGGDFYKCYASPDGKKYVVGCFDVSGKGVAAALSTMAIGSFFAALPRFLANLKFGTQITGILDDYVQEIIPMGTFITAAICYIDYEAGTISIQNCGHTPMYVFEPDTENVGKVNVKKVNPNLPPLGMGAISSQPQTAVVLPIRSKLRIVMYSDGLTDMQSTEGERFEEERTHQLFLDTYGMPNDAFMTTVDNTIKLWITEAMLIDDITIMNMVF